MVIAALLCAQLTVPAADARVATVGHVQRSAAGLELRWSLSEVRLRFTGTSLALEVEEDASDADTNVLVVEVNGQRRDLTLAPGRSRVTLAGGLPPGAHTLTLIRRNEASVGTTRIVAILIDDDAQLLPPPPPRALRVELLGDSLATAFGVSGEGPTCGFSAATQDATLGFAGLLREALPADVSVVAWSGRGVLRDIDGRTELPAVPALWSAAPAPEGPPPDVVLVVLGANDFFASAPPREAFLSSARALLQQIHARHPAAAVVWATPRLAALKGRDRTLAAWVRDAARAQHVPVTSLWLPLRDEADGWGCTWHPSVTTHRRYAATLEPLLRRLASHRSAPR